MDAVQQLIAARSRYRWASEHLRRQRNLLNTPLGSPRQVCTAEHAVRIALTLLANAQTSAMIKLAHADKTLDVVHSQDIVVCREGYISKQRKLAAEYGAWREYRNSRAAGRMPKRFAHFGDPCPNASSALGSLGDAE